MKRSARGVLGGLGNLGRQADQVVERRQRRLGAFTHGDDDLLVGCRRRIAGREHAGDRGRAALVDLDLAARREGHAVLLVETTNGVFVLDNRHKDPKPWKSLGYNWHSRQVPGQSTWELIND